MSDQSSPAYLFGDLLALARQSWVRQMASRLGQRGYRDYRRSDAAALRILRRGSLSIGEIGAALGVTRQAARKLVDGLERRGYAHTARAPRDSRRLNVLLTRAGEDYARAVIEVLETINRELAGRVDPTQLRAADNVLRATLDDAARERAQRLNAPPGRAPGRGASPARARSSGRKHEDGERQRCDLRGLR